MCVLGGGGGGKHSASCSNYLPTDFMCLCSYYVTNSLGPGCFEKIHCADAMLIEDYTRL